MRVCDKCKESIKNKMNYMVEVQCFNDVGQYIASKSYYLELCSTCYKKIFEKN